MDGHLQQGYTFQLLVFSTLLVYPILLPDRRCGRAEARHMPSQPLHSSQHCRPSSKSRLDEPDGVLSCDYHHRHTVVTIVATGFTSLSLTAKKEYYFVPETSLLYNSVACELSIGSVLKSDEAGNEGRVLTGSIMPGADLQRMTGTAKRLDRSDKLKLHCIQVPWEGLGTAIWSTQWGRGWVAAWETHSRERLQSLMVFLRCPDEGLQLQCMSLGKQQIVLSGVALA